MTFVEDVLQKINNLKTLEIRTVIGEFKWNEDTLRIDYEEDKVKVIMTQIDLIEGDITTSFSPEFLSPPLDEVRKYHAEKEKEGHAIIEANLKALGELINLIQDKLHG